MEEHLPLPELSGTHGKAWRYNIQDSRACLAVVEWMIEAPKAHPFWHSYYLSLMHFRIPEGGPTPVIYLPGATHEIVLYALDPFHPRRIHELPKTLDPANFAAQIIDESDEHAEAKITDAVQDIVDGKLNPDSDAIGQWIERFGDNMVKK